MFLQKSTVIYISLEGLNGSLLKANMQMGIPLGKESCNKEPVLGLFPAVSIGRVSTFSR